VPNVPVGFDATAAAWNLICPVGVVLPYGGAAAPTDWLVCDGASYLRADYPDLFDAIGTAYGSADADHFNVPDTRGRVPVGYAAAGGHTDVSALGGNDGVDVANRRAKHRHTVTDPQHSHGYTDDIYGQSATVGGNIEGTDNGLLLTGSSKTTAAASTGIGVGSGASDSLDAPAYLVLNFIIKT
jgi:microcystin-dependent protein